MLTFGTFLAANVTALLTVRTQEGSGLYGDLTLPQVKFPLMGEGFCVQTPQSTEDF